MEIFGKNHLRTAHPLWRLRKDRQSVAARHLRPRNARPISQADGLRCLRTGQHRKIQHTGRRVTYRLLRHRRTRIPGTLVQRRPLLERAPRCTAARRHTAAVSLFSHRRTRGGSRHPHTPATLSSTRCTGRRLRRTALLI